MPYFKYSSYKFLFGINSACVCFCKYMKWNRHAPIRQAEYQQNQQLRIEWVLTWIFLKMIKLKLPFYHYLYFLHLYFEAMLTTKATLPVRKIVFINYNNNMDKHWPLLFLQASQVWTLLIYQHIMWADGADCKQHMPLYDYWTKI